MRAIPMFIICMLLPQGYRVQLPSLAGFGAWFISTVGAIFLSVSITSLVHAYVLVMQRVDGLVRVINAMAEMFSGMIIPLALMPDFMAAFLKYQPFAGVIDLPVQLYCGSIPPEGVLWVLALQLAWTAMFGIAGRAVTRKGLKQVVLAGG